MTDVIFVNVGRDGVIVFEHLPGLDLGRLTVASAPASKAKRLREVVTANARHAYDGVTLLVPGIPEAKSENEAVDAAIRFRALIEERMGANG